MILPQLNRDHLHRKGAVYSTSRLLAKIEEVQVPVTIIKVEDLTWMLHFDMPNYTMAERSDLNRPLVVIEGEGKLRIIDGYHRFIKAVEEKAELLPAHIVDQELLDTAKLTFQEYQDTMYEREPGQTPIVPR